MRTGRKRGRGQVRERSRSLNVLDRDVGDAELPGWLTRPGRAGRTRGAAWRDLRKSRKRVLPLARARPGHVWTLAQRKTILATALLLADDLDQAVEVTGEIIDEAEQMQSGHVRAEVLGLARQRATPVANVRRPP